METRLDQILDRMENRVETMSAYCDQMRLDAKNARIQHKLTVEFILSALEVASDLQNHDAGLTSRIRALGKKAELRAGLDTWFWRPETNGMEFRNMLRKRAAYLKASGYSIDQAWDLLVEFISGWSGQDLDEELLKEVVAEKYV